MTTFHPPVNDATADRGAKVAAARSAGSPTVTVVDGALYGTTFPIFATAARAGVTLAIFEVTGRTGNDLTVSGAVDGTTDVALQVDDAFEPRPNRIAITEIHDAINALESTVVVLPYATDAQSEFPGVDVACRGDSLTVGAGGTPYPTQLAALVPRNFINDGVGGYTSTQIKDLTVADPNVTTASSIIWSGRNNIASGTTVAADDATMVAAIGHDRYLILGVLNGSGEGTGTTLYDQIQAINATKASTYPGHYVAIREHLVSLYDPGQTQDVTDHANDIVPTSLRFDNVHLNTAGYGAVAAFLATYQAVLDGPVVPLKPASLAPAMLAGRAAIHTTGAETAAGAKTFTDKATFDAPSTADSTVAIGPIEIQAYGLDNCWIGQNFYYDGGAYRYRAAGTAQQVYFVSGQFIVNVAPTGAAGGAITWTTAIHVAADSSTTLTTLTVLNAFTAGTLAGDGHLLTGLTSTQVSGLGTAATHAATDFALVASNLSDLASAATARANLGLGTMAVQAATAVAITGGSVAGVALNEYDRPFGAASVAAGATTTLDLTTHNDWAITLNGTGTLAFTGDSGNQPITLKVLQNATGGFTLTWPGTVTWFTANFAAPTLAAGANKATYVLLRRTGTGTYDGFLAGASGA